MNRTHFGRMAFRAKNDVTSNHDQMGCASKAHNRPVLMAERPMTPVQKAIWFIESHYARDISLDEIAVICGVSRFHMSRAFGAATGHSVMGYVRARRLTQAAFALAKGAPDILSVALDAGYGSHEAFTRAFRDRFGQTPEEVRAKGAVPQPELVEPLKMDETFVENLAPPRLVDGGPLLIAGFGERYTCETSIAIPSLWQRFGPHFGSVPGQKNGLGYGVCCNSDDDSFEYIAGVEVADFSGLTSEFSRIRIPPQRYVVFATKDHISAIRRITHTVWSKWLPASGHEAADAPNFELYPESFDPVTGNGGYELWIPIKS